MEPRYRVRGQSGGGRRLHVRVRQGRAPAIPERAREWIGQRRRFRADTGSRTRDAAAELAAGEVLGDRTAIGAAEREALIAHGAGGQRVDNRLRRTSTQSIRRRRPLIVAVVTTAAMPIEERGTIGPRRGGPAGGGFAQKARGGRGRG